MKRLICFMLISCMMLSMFQVVGAQDATRYMPGNTRGYNFGEGSFNKESLMEKFMWAKPFNVNDPAIPAEHLENAEARREAGMEQRNNIIAAAKAWMEGTGPDTYTIPTGVYRVIDKYPIDLSGIKNFTVKAEPNVFFYMEQSRKTADYFQPFINLNYCENVKIIGDAQTRMVSDNIVFGSTQGKVTAVDASDRGSVKLTVDIMPGYVGYNENMFDYLGVTKVMNYMMFDDKGARLQNTMIQTRDIVYKSGSTYTLTLDSNVYNEYNLIDSMFKEGYYVSLRLHTRNGINLGHSGNITIENVGYYGGDFFVGEGKSTASNFFTNVRGARREGSGRLMGVAGSQQTYLSGAPVYTNAEFGYTWDDLINVCDWGIATYQQESPREVIIFPKGGDGYQTFEGTAGKKVEFFDFDSKNRTDSGTIVSVENISDPKLVNDFLAAMSSKNMVPFGGTTLVRVTFDKDMNVKLGDIVQVQDRHPTDAIFRDSYLHDGTCRLLVNGTSRLVIENSILERTALPAVSVEMSTYWMEGAVTTDIIMKDNLIIDGRYAPFSTGAGQPAMAAVCITTEAKKDSPIGYAHERFQITGNTFVDSDWSSLYIANSKDILISGNKFINTGAQRYKASYIPGSDFFGEDPTSAVYLHSVKDVIIENNEVTETNSHVNTVGNAFKIGKKNASDANIVIRNNYVNGVKQEGEIIKGEVPTLSAVAEASPVYLNVVMPAPKLKDINGHWAQKTIEKLVEENVVSGYEDYTFRPEDNVLVNEFIKLAIASKYEVQKSDTDWAKPYIDKAIETGIVVNGEFDNYERPINRGEMFRIIVRLMGISTTGKDSFIPSIKDYDSIADQYKGYVLAAYAVGLTTGYEDGTFQADRETTRAEAATVILRVMEF